MTARPTSIIPRSSSVLFELARSRRTGGGSSEATQRNPQKQFSVLQLISAYRFQGNRIANVDPLKRMEQPAIAELDPSFYGLTDQDMDAVFETGTLHGPAKAPLRDILQALRDTYCGTIGVEYMYISRYPAEALDVGEAGTDPRPPEL